MLNTKEIIESLVYGGATGDAVGASYENKTARGMKVNAKDLRTAGIWTDDIHQLSLL